MEQNLKDISDRLEIWRKERGLDVSQGFEFDLNTQCSFLFEEIGVEYLRAKNNINKIDALCDVSIYAINGLSLLDKGIDFLLEYLDEEFEFKISFINILQDATDSLKTHSNPLGYFRNIAMYSKIIIENMGYDYFKCMDETLKEVESGKGAFNPESGKWEKFKDEESQKLWYKADYNSCKIVA